MRRNTLSLLYTLRRKLSHTLQRQW
jgi:hypothetical protein